MKRLIKQAVMTLAVLAVVCSGPQRAEATFTNGSFETGDFTGWATIGSTSIETAAFDSGPTDGTFQAFLLTEGARVSDTDIEAALNLTPGALDALSATTPGGGDATEGSAISQVLMVNAGDILSFDVNFLTNEFTPEDSFNDFSFFLSFGDSTLIADTNAVFALSPTRFDEETGFLTITQVIPTSGTFTLGFGVLDVGDMIVDSAILVDNVFIDSVIPNPEPGTMMLMGSGLLGLLGYGWRRKQQKAA